MLLEVLKLIKVELNALGNVLLLAMYKGEFGLEKSLFLEALYVHLSLIELSHLFCVLLS
jgi:hypothetical protein